MSPSTISASPSYGGRLFGTLLLLTLLAGCGPTQVHVQGQFPAPLVDRVPITLGVWYSDEFKGHEFFDEAKTPQDSDWVVRTGEAQVQMWSKVLQGMFTSVVFLQHPPGSITEDVDAILIPEVAELQYAIPTHTNIRVYEIWMRYRFTLQEADGSPIASWLMSAYGKTPTALLQSDEQAVNLAAIMALRDAGANFSTGFTKQAAVNDWLTSRNLLPKTEVVEP